MIKRTMAFGTILILTTACLAQERHALETLARRSWCELETIYRAAEPGAMPHGFFRGHSIYCPEAFLAGPRMRGANFLWQGKHFRGDDGTLINQFIGVKLIRAKVTPGESWLDGKQAWILDYQGTSLLWHDVRDEMREVAPGVYLGAMFLRRCPEPKLKVLFILEKEDCR